MSLTSTRRKLPTASDNDVLVAARHALDSVHVHAALVREGGLPEPTAHGRRDGCLRPRSRIRKVPELGAGIRRHATQAHLICNAGDDADQIAIAVALAIAVDGALHLHGTGLDGRRWHSPRQNRKSL